MWRLHVSEQGPDHLFSAVSPLLPRSSTGTSPAPPPARRASAPFLFAYPSLPGLSHNLRVAADPRDHGAAARPLLGRARPELQPQGWQEPIHHLGTKPPLPQCPTLPPPVPPSSSPVGDLELDEADGVEEGPRQGRRRRRGLDGGPPPLPVRAQVLPRRSPPPLTPLLWRSVSSRIHHCGRGNGRGGAARGHGWPSW
jgi:hypothetical protein